jgi:predicted small secreted protein
MMKKHCSVWMALAILLLLSACNTVKGMGQDLQKAGEKIEDVAKKK